MSDPIHRLAEQLSRLPGVGAKTAARLAYHLVQAPKAHVRELAAALLEAIDSVRLCEVCANLTESRICSLCSDTRRDATAICVVAYPSDVTAIDRGGAFRGHYHVLHGVLSPLEGVGPDDLRVEELLRRLRPQDAPYPTPVSEVIIATSANVEGEATAMYLARLIKPLSVSVSRIASGIPVGGELEYSDQATITRALNARVPM